MKKMKCLILYVWLLLLQYHSLNASDTFYVSIQEDETGITDRVVVRPLVPWTDVNFNSFSICFWVYSKFQNEAISAYATLYIVSKEVPSFPAFGIYSYADTEDGHDGRNVKIGIDVDEAKVDMESKLGQRRWDHICLVYSENKGKIYVNGELSSEFGLPSQAFDFVKEFKSETFEMMLGQEPDSWEGDFNPKQTLRGRVSEFNVWDSEISMEMVGEMAKCKTKHQGNIAKWEVGNCDFINTTPQNIKLEEFCAPFEKLFMVTEKMLFHEAITFCKIHDGYLYSPSSEEKNQQFLSMLKEKNDECVIPNIGHTEGVLSWIGLVRNEKKELLNVKDEKSPAYTNFVRPPNNISACFILRTDGYFYASTRECISVRMCFVCGLSADPIYSLRGLCLESTYTLNYYLEPTDEGLSYVGYMSGSIQGNSSQWTILNGIPSEGNSILKSHKKPRAHPLGRNMWEVNDTTCGRDDVLTQLTLSACSSSEYFTCDSGECVQLPTRCNGTLECLDESDEHDCSMVQVDETYMKAMPPELPGGINPLNISLQILQFDKIDTLELTITLTVEIRIQWIDPRITLDSIDTTVDEDGKIVKTELEESSREQMWLPLDHIFFYNGILGTTVVDDITTVTANPTSEPKLPSREDSVNSIQFNGIDAYLVMERKFQATFFCEMDIFNFPFDKQSCQVTIAIRTQGDNSIRLVPSEDFLPVEYQGSKNLKLFQLGEIRLITLRIVLWGHSLHF
ncbi:uncharacterized protein LOC111706994 isoform X2 [Eurytemora carolleeae]|uniref:uncharacterized protein LOC111706994 isoform X2 n=1 Tax=Eurytemora carolleeae TaxID=1294199 RepID=UPI000C76BF11|nr:uncharacterized protein LOC111706994 isoform X2 [Eurytemora carolleeae]|eukprot:XP_023335729.1 uncharacterized protein LOC111706994 isoform X2 [Eurytemora affinis]